MLLSCYGYSRIGSFLNYFDGREGVQAEMEQIIEEKIYSPPTIAETHDKMANNAAMVKDLQDKMDELLKLKNESIEINNNLYI
jgi:hypothetical protein